MTACRLPARGRLRAGALAKMGLMGFVAAGAHTTSPAGADDARMLAYGRHLASECAPCHRVDGAGNGIPSIASWPAAAFIETMGYYKSGARTNPVMVSVAQSLDDEQVRALAAYYGSLPRQDRRQ